MSPVSQRSLGCTGMRHLEQLGRGTEKTPGPQHDEMERGMERGELRYRGLESEDEEGVPGASSQEGVRWRQTHALIKENLRDNESVIFISTGSCMI